MNNRKIGRFRVSRQLVAERPDDIAEALAMIGFVPVRCEMLYAWDSFEYTGISERFAVCDLGNIPPEYDMQITRDELGGIKRVDIIPQKE